MKLTLKRTTFTPHYTLGVLYVDGLGFCDTLEPPDRAIEWDGIKLSGQTAVPIGTYPVTLTHSAHFRRILPILHRVPHFEGIRIHSGNTVADTLGCILVGVSDGQGTLSVSRYTLENLIGILRAQKHITLQITR